LLQGLLKYEPSERLKASEALSHPFFKEGSRFHQYAAYNLWECRFCVFITHSKVNSCCLSLHGIILVFYQLCWSQLQGLHRSLELLKQANFEPSIFQKESCWCCIQLVKVPMMCLMLTHNKIRFGVMFLHGTNVDWPSTLLGSVARTSWVPRNFWSWRYFETSIFKERFQNAWTSSMQM